MSPTQTMSSADAKSVFYRAHRFADLGIPEAAIAAYEGLTEQELLATTDAMSADEQLSSLRQLVPATYEQSGRRFERTIEQLDEDGIQAVAWARNVVLWAMSAFTQVTPHRDTQKLRDRLEKAQRIYDLNSMQPELGLVKILLAGVETLDGKVEKAHTIGREGEQIVRSFGLPTFIIARSFSRAAVERAVSSTN